MVADRLLDEPVGRHRQYYRQCNDKQAVEQAEAAGARVFQGKGQQRPVPEVDAEGNLAEAGQVTAGQPAVGDGLDRGAAGDDQGDGGGHRDQRDVAGELGIMGGQEAEQQQGSQPEQAEQVA
ncbi:hypothetical protein D9M71_774430 [compost metagenome]